MDIYEKLRKEIRGEVTRNESLARYTSYQIGGLADVLAFPAEQADVLNAMEIARESEQPLFLMGGGTNLLIRDGGIRGVVLNLSRYLPEKVEDMEDGTVLRTYAGMKMVRLSSAALERSLAGLEFAAGIPGPVGRRRTSSSGPGC